MQRTTVIGNTRRPASARGYPHVSRLPGMLKEFRDFVLRGNVVELAVAIVIGTAFTQLVQVFVAAFVSPLISMFAGKSGLVDLRFSINEAVFRYGAFLQAVIT